jgi:hypothetical protein
VNNKFPDYLIIELKSELNAFRSIVCELDMPVIEADEALVKITNSINYLPTSTVRLTCTAFLMSKGIGLSENYDNDNGAEERVINAVNKLGNQIKNKLIAINAYSDNYFPYALRRMLNANTIVFEKNK